MSKITRCGGCTVCCDLFEVAELQKPANTQCKFCKKGCTIHSTRPQVCRDYECAYYQNDSAHIDLRPDNCKMVFEKMSERLFYGLQHPDYEITDVARSQIAAFVNQGFSVIVKVPSKISVDLFLAVQHDRAEIESEFREKLKKLVRLRNGVTEVSN